MAKILILLTMVLSTMVFGYSSDSGVLVADNCQNYDEAGSCIPSEAPEADVYMREPAAEQAVDSGAEPASEPGQAPADVEAGASEEPEQEANENY